MSAYYNEFEPYAAEWLKNLIAAGLIPAGDVDTRSILEVKADDLKGYTQCHFFAGIGGWAYAARLAGWPDARPLWTGSCPCQPFSSAGKQKGTEDERHLWPVWFELIRACTPPVVMGEQVAAAIGKDWLDRVYSDLEGEGYACGSAVLPACAVNAPHRRDRLWFVAENVADSANAWQRRTRNAEMEGSGNPVAGRDAPGKRIADSENIGERGHDSPLANSEGNGCGQGHTNAGRSDAGNPAEQGAGFERAGSGALGDPCSTRSPAWISAPPSGCQGNAEIADNGSGGRLGPWSECNWIIGADRKARRVKPGIRLLADGVPARVGKLRAFGNAIVPQVAAEVIGAFMEVAP